MDEFVACYNTKDRTSRKESERFKSFTYEEPTSAAPQADEHLDDSRELVLCASRIRERDLAEDAEDVDGGAALCG